MGKSKGIRKFKLFHIIILGLVIYFFSIFIKQQIMINDLKEKKAFKEEEIRQLQNEIDKIAEKVQYNHSLEYVEKIARDELGMVKSGEIIFIDANQSKNKFIKGIKD